jgi:hypothetical protein
MQKLKEGAGWILFVIIILTVTYFIGERNRLKFKNEILKYPGHSTGVFKRLKYEKGKPILGVYYFDVDGAIIEGAKADARIREHWRYLRNKSFPVIYSLKDPEKNVMLLTPSDFEEYNLKFPDSLNWVKEFID